MHFLSLMNFPFLLDGFAKLRATLLIAAFSLTGLSAAKAVTVYDSNGFEPGRFAATIALEGQDAAPLGQGPWVRSNAATSNANGAAVVDNSNNPNGDFQSVRVVRAANQNADTRWFVTKLRDMTPVPADNVINIEVDLRVNQSALPSDGPAPAYGIEAYDGQTLIGSATVDAVEGFLRYAQSGTGAYTKVSGSTLVLGGPGAGAFHHLTLSLNFTKRTYSILVNDVLRHTEPFVNSAAANFTDAPIAAVSIGGAPAGNSTAFFDNYRITQVPAVLPPAAGPLTVYPLGDSITWGYTTASAADSPGGYREPLFRNLRLANLPIDFVGANTSNPGPLLSQSGEINHDGYPKYTITDVYDNLNASRQPWGNNQPSNNGGFWLTGRTGRSAIFPANTLLLIGTNDIESGVTQASTIESRLEKLVTRIFALRPDTHVFLTNIPPYPVDTNKTAVAKAYGELIRTQTVPRFLAQGRKITFVDQYSNFIAASPNGEVVNSALFGDTVHPNEAGYQKMGDTWAAAILNVPTAAPAAPAAVTAAAASDREINLSWSDASTNEGAFLIERSSDNLTFTRIAQVTANETSYADLGLPASTAFYYRVRARNVAGDSAYSNVASASTQAPSPSAPPSGLAATVGSAQVNLTWNAPTGATGYNVKRSASDGGPYAVIGNTTATNYADTTVENDRTYYYVVSAMNNVGESANSSQVSATPSGSPTAWYEFELNTLDSSGNNNHGAPVGTVLYGEGQAGANSAQFDGTAFVEITRVVSADFTVAMRVKTTSNASGGQWYQGMGLVDGEMVGSAADWGCSILNSKFALGIGAPDKTISTNRSVNDGEWHHIVATRNSSTGVVQLYVDGVLDKTDSAATGPRTAPNELRIGATHANPPVRFVGNIDDLRLYGRVLSGGEVFSLAHPAGNTAPTISSIPDRTVKSGGSTGPIDFTVNDVETPEEALTVTGTSSDPTLVPNENITFGGSGRDRTVTINAAPDREGTATITLTVTDGEFNTSTSFQLKVVAAPAITSHPQSQSILVGGTATFSVTATSSEPLSYQWQFNGAAIAGATQASYTVSSAQLSHAGDYTVIVSNIAASVTSAAATLTVNMDAVFSGRAFVLSANILGVSGSWSDTGPRPDAGGAQEASLFSIAQPGLSAEVAHAFSLGQGDRTYSEASAANVVIDVQGVVVRADFVMSRALAAWDTDHTTVSGVSEVTNLTIAGQPVVVTGEPNQVIPFVNGRLIVNEQITSETKITVNALHLTIDGTADVVVASAHAGFEAIEPVVTWIDHVSGGGWITGTPTGGKGTFGMNAGIRENGTFSGSVSYMDHASRMKIKATSITAYGEGSTANGRRIEGTAEVDGVAGYTFVLEVTDNGEPGSDDTFRIGVSNGYEAGGTLGGGNIQLF
jgi:hypothetical protein